jgi:hypothetical protein
MRRKFRYDEKLDCLVEITREDVPRRRDDLLQNDRIYDGMKATDGTDISSRTKHREYMKANGLTTMDDFKEEWSKAAEERAKYYTGEKGAVKGEDIARAIHQLESRRNRR